MSDDTIDGTDGKDGNDLAAAFILNTRWDALPAAVQQRARMCLLDDLGAVIGGTLTRLGQIGAAWAAERMPGDEATILRHRARSTAVGAAFANACAGNGLDVDDDIKYTRGHPGAQLLPAALAVAEKVGASGTALLEALVVGYEIASAAGRCWHDHHNIYQACGSWGSLSCAAAAARLMGLDAGQVRHALGIAEYQAPNAPMMRDVDNPSMVKHAVHWGALNGVMAAELAGRGFTGIPSLLGFEQYRDWVSGLGRTYVMGDGVGVKQWCSCAWGHPAMAAAQQTVQAHGIRPQEIAHLKVRTFHEGWRLFRGMPTTTEQAQFSVRWPLAILLLEGEVGPNQMLEHRLDDAEVRALVEKIEIVEDPEIDQIYRAPEGSIDFSEGRFAGRVEIRLADGRLIDSGIVRRRAYEWDTGSLDAKFRWIAGHVLDAQTVERVADMAWRFDDVASVKELTALLQ